MSEVLDSMWVEKYRPKKLSELSLPERYTQDFKRMIERGSLPNNLLFTGPPGGGKTTLALILCSKQGILFNKKDNLLMANGSSKKGRSINFVDQVVEPFLKHPPAGDKYKVVFMDEADNITGDSYDSWRGIIEKYHKAYGRFIWTGNYISKIPDPVQSRFTPYVFQQIPKEFVLNYCKSILESEKVEYIEKDITFVINQLYPDVRKIINILQRCSLEGNLNVDRDAVVTNERVLMAHVVEIISLIVKSEDRKIGGVINKMIDILASQDLEYRNIYSELFFMKTIPAPAKIIVNKFANSHQNCLIPHQHFMAMVFAIIKALQDYRLAKLGK
jgi:replication factor C small subunit